MMLLALTESEQAATPFVWAIMAGVAALGIVCVVVACWSDRQHQRAAQLKADLAASEWRNHLENRVRLKALPDHANVTPPESSATFTDYWAKFQSDKD